MLTDLATVKARLGIGAADVTNDTILTRAIAGISARFDLECNRTLARTVNATFEFAGDEVHLVVPCYPVESILSFEVKESESAGWVVQAEVEAIVRRRCVVSLPFALGTALQQARMTYTGGYVLPGTVPGEGETALPTEIEQAAVEQVAYWFQMRNSVGVWRSWPVNGDYKVYADPDLLPSVRAVLARHTRFLL